MKKTKFDTYSNKHSALVEAIQWTQWNTKEVTKEMSADEFFELARSAGYGVYIIRKIDKYHISKPDEFEKNYKKLRVVDSNFKSD